MVGIYEGISGEGERKREEEIDDPEEDLEKRMRKEFVED